METQETPFYIYDTYVDPSEDLVNLDVNEGTDYDPSKLYTESGFILVNGTCNDLYNLS